MWLEVDSVKAAWSRPAHQRVTQAVRRLLSKVRRKIEKTIAVCYCSGTRFLHTCYHSYHNTFSYFYVNPNRDIMADCLFYNYSYKYINTHRDISYKNGYA